MKASRKWKSTKSANPYNLKLSREPNVKKKAKKKVLIVDDEKGICEVLSAALKNEGYVPVTASTGEEALGILEDETTIFCMLIDLKLPGMNGVELCRKLRKHHLTACIHAMTGYGNEFELLHCRAAGFDDYFLKPFDLKLVIKTVKESFEKLERWGEI